MSFTPGNWRTTQIYCSFSKQERVVLEKPSQLGKKHADQWPPEWSVIIIFWSVIIMQRSHSTLARLGRCFTLRFINAPRPTEFYILHTRAPVAFLVLSSRGTHSLEKNSLIKEEHWSWKRLKLAFYSAHREQKQNIRIGCACGNWAESSVLVVWGKNLSREVTCRETQPSSFVLVLVLHLDVFRAYSWICA